MQYEQFRQFRFGKKVAPFAFATDRITKRATIIPSARVCENSSLVPLSRTPVRDLAFSLHRKTLRVEMTIFTHSGGVRNPSQREVFPSRKNLYFRDLSISTRFMNFGDNSRRRSSDMRPLRVI
jgi:hypothetical protein